MNKVLSPVGLKLVPARHDLLHYQHNYSGGFAEYRSGQVHWNKAKFDKVWADPTTLQRIADDILSHGLAREGLCHGARNGWEVEWFAKALNCTVIGTDISETAESVPNLVCHDFHEPNPNWLGRFSFIYTNSLDQAFDPEKALNTWTDQLAGDGRIYIEHTMAHSAAGASEMDPFGAHPMVVPYLLHEWGKGHYRMADILHLDRIEGKNRVWVFVIERS